jgi:hypothetical protein
MQINSEISLRRGPRWGGEGQLCTPGQYKTKFYWKTGSEARSVSFGTDAREEASSNFWPQHRIWMVRAPI